MDSKEKIFKDYSPFDSWGGKLIVNHIVTQCNKLSTNKDKIRILDWGCGQGRFVYWLLSQGYDAYGVDINEPTIENSRTFFTSQNLDPKRLALIDDQGTTPFLDDFFNIVISKQVFEHVEDLSKAINEIHRITAPNGTGYHNCPAPLQFIEGHLYMPLVHWLPKNQLRKFAILCFVALGVEPHWHPNNDLTIKEKAQTYYNYTLTKTFYRSYPQIRDEFSRSGFNVKEESINHPILKEYRAAYYMSRSNILKPLIQQLLRTFFTLEIETSKL
jgi:SAM-dependent methyltransferase